MKESDKTGQVRPDNDRKNNMAMIRKSWLLPGLLLAAACCILIGSLTDRNPAEGSTEETAGFSSAETADSTSPETTAAASLPSETQGMPARPTAGNDPKDSAPDPQAEGYYYDAALTELLIAYFTDGMTNVTDPADPHRSLSASHKSKLDDLAEKWRLGELSDEAAKEKMEQLSFRWPDESSKAEHSLAQSAVNVYRCSGRDPLMLRNRIRLSNTAARHYLYLRVYYSTEEDRCRVYMINGMIF